MTDTFNIMAHLEQNINQSKNDVELINKGILQVYIKNRPDPS